MPLATIMRFKLSEVHMLKTQNNPTSSASEIKDKFKDFDRLGEVNEENQTIELKPRFENDLVAQQKWKVPLPVSKKKIEIVTAVSEFISKAPNITKSIIKFRDQIKTSNEIVLSLREWDHLEIVFTAASIDDFDGRFDHFGSSFADHNSVCDELAEAISNELNAAEIQYQNI